MKVGGEGREKISELCFSSLTVLTNHVIILLIFFATVQEVHEKDVCNQVGLVTLQRFFGGAKVLKSISHQTGASQTGTLSF